ncbi:MAG TPA: hypothetical protein VL400_07805 [Polyangiaceae bacterium]|nr:hypothetical protein [Polyangiaceae bacterium]
MTLTFLALAACGDSGDTTGSGGSTSSTGGSGGATSSGGGGEAPLSATAEACATNDTCEGGACISEDLSGWAAGYCSQLCDPTFAPCAASDECVMLTNNASFCLAKCATDADCKGAGQTCVDLYGDGTAFACIGGCSMDSQCSVTCNNDVGSCTQTPEACDNQSDDDGEGFTDCEDADCGADATCQATISGACTGAEDISAGGTFTGNTSTGTNAFATVCASLFGNYLGGAAGNEKIYKFTATETGNLTLDVTATTGSVDWYLRTDCADSTTSLGVCGTETAGAAGFPVKAGDTLYLYVDGYMGDADYSVDVSFAALAPVCAAATAVTDGATNGNTTSGSDAMGSSCGGGGKEQVYTYTPAATGMLDLTLASATDQGLHVRTDCLDGASEIGCADSELGGTDETLSVPVTAGTPITIVVDAYSPGEEGPFTLTITP